MANILRWPDEFKNPDPVVSFGTEFVDFLRRMIESSANVSADEYWTSFAMERKGRFVDFIRRGRLRRGQSECWEVRLAHNGNGVWLGKVFGIHECACVVVEGFDHVRTAAETWLDGSDLKSMLRSVTYWDKSNPAAPLELPTNGDTGDHG